MKESIGYTVSLNIMIVFITIVMAFLCAAIIYFKSNKASNIITNAIEKYEGYNTYSRQEINMNLDSIGYGSRTISCNNKIIEKNVIGGECTLTKIDSQKERYCVYLCKETNGEYYYFKIRTNMMINIPIINDIMDIPIYSDTNRMYDFGDNY